MTSMTENIFEARARVKKNKLGTRTRLKRRRLRLAETQLGALVEGLEEAAKEVRGGFTLSRTGNCVAKGSQTYYLYI